MLPDVAQRSVEVVMSGQLLVEIDHPDIAVSF
jgi:hypothetical protein